MPQNAAGMGTKGIKTDKDGHSERQFRVPSTPPNDSGASPLPPDPRAASPPVLRSCPLRWARPVTREGFVLLLAAVEELDDRDEVVTLSQRIVGLTTVCDQTRGAEPRAECQNASTSMAEKSADKR
jgi:hypothetical protein